MKMQTSDSLLMSSKVTQKWTMVVFLQFMILKIWWIFCQNLFNFTKEKHGFPNFLKFLVNKKTKFVGKKSLMWTRKRWVDKEIRTAYYNNALSCEFAKPFLDSSKSHKCMAGKKYVPVSTWTYRRVIGQPLAGVSRTVTIVSQPW